jgi:hypothetical protein
MRKILPVLFLLFSLTLSTAEAAYLDLAWDLNQEADLAGYRVYYGTSSRGYINSVDIGNTTGYRMNGLLDGVTYYIALTAYDMLGNESDFSQEVSTVGVVDNKGKLMVVRQRTDGKYKLHIYDTPTDVGGNTGPRVASDRNIGMDVIAIGGGEWDGVSGDELVRMVGSAGEIRELLVSDMPQEIGGDTGRPDASDRSFGRNRDYMAVGNFDDDDDDEVAVTQYVDAREIYRLYIYDMPSTLEGNTGSPIASDSNIGGNIVGIAAANFDLDPEDEVVVVRRGRDGTNRLQIYDVPITVRGDTGSPIVSDTDIGRNIITYGVAAGNFDNDPEPEVAVVRLRASERHKVEIYDAPTRVRGDTGPAIASDNNIGRNVTAIAACQFTPGP